MKSWKRTLTASLVPLIALFLWSCGSVPLTTKVHDQDGFAKSTTIAILDFSGRDTSVRYSGNVDSLGHAMAVLLQKELGKKAGSLVVYLGDNDSLSTGLVLEGKFTTIDEGDAAARIMLGAEGVTVAVEGKIKKPGGATVAEFTKSKTSSGGPLGMGGLLAGDSDVIIEDIMEEIAKDLAEFIIGNRK